MFLLFDFKLTCTGCFSGNLYFANIKEEDDIEGKNYVCTVQNDKLRSMSQGDDAVIVPFLSGSTPPNNPATFF